MISFSKNYLSIAIIGKIKFFTGLFVGVLFAFILNLFFSYSREVLRMITIFSEDLLMVSDHEFFIYNLFFSSISLIVGFSITIWFWFHSKPTYNKRHHLLNRNSSNYSLLIGFLILAIISRFGSILSFTLYGPGYENNLNFYEDQKLLLYLVPIMGFQLIWNPILHAYKATKWWLISWTIFLLLSFTFSKLTAVDQSILNNAFNNKYSDELNNIKTEIKKASEIGVSFESTTLSILRKNKTESSTKQILEIKNRFESNDEVPLDTVILHYLIVKNLKTTYYDIHRGDDYNNWPYALPYNVFKQYRITEDSVKKEYLEQTLLLMKDIFRKREWDIYNIQNLSHLERRKLYIGRTFTFIAPKVQEDLNEILKLINNEKNGP